MINKVGVAVAAVMLLAGCAGSGEAEKTVTVTASEARASSSTVDRAGISLEGLSSDQGPANDVRSALGLDVAATN